MHGSRRLAARSASSLALSRGACVIRLARRRASDQIRKCSFAWVARLRGAALGGLFHVARSSARIAVRGRRDAGLVAAGTAARGGTLRPASPDASGRGVRELLAHALE